LELRIAPILATLILSGAIPLRYYREWLIAPDQVMTSSSIVTLSLSRSIASYHAQLLRWSIPKQPTAAYSTSPHSHSIVLSHDKALIYRCKYFLRLMKNRPPDPSEISALEFKGEFRRFKIFSVSTTIDIDRPIFKTSRENGGVAFAKKDRWHDARWQYKRYCHSTA